MPSLSQFSETVLALTTAESVKDLWQKLLAALAPYGFTQISYGMSRLHKDISLPMNEDDVFLTTLPMEGINGYFNAVFFMRTPMFRWATQNIGAGSWRWAQDERLAGRLSEEEIAAQDLARRGGLSAGYTISCYDDTGCTRGAYSLGATAGISQDEVDAIWQHRGTEITALCNVAHLKMRVFPTPSLRRRLSPRQRETLQWVAEGKTSQDIATIMGISPAMVEKHLRLARESLDVETTAHAVAKAAIHNHLFSLPSLPSK